MTQSWHPYITLVICAALLWPMAAGGAQLPPASATPRQFVPVSGDHGPWQRDPFNIATKRGAATSGSKAAPLKTAGRLPKTEHDQYIELQGIVQSGNSYHALVNGMSVKVGDKIGGVTIKEISRFKIVVQNERKEKVVYDIYQGRTDRGKK